MKIDFQTGKENPRHGSKKPLAGVISGPLLQWTSMAKEKLMEWGLTEEQATNAIKGVDVLFPASCYPPY